MEWLCPVDRLSPHNSLFCLIRNKSWFYLEFADFATRSAELLPEEKRAAKQFINSSQTYDVQNASVR